MTREEEIKARLDYYTAVEYHHPSLRGGFK